MTTVSTQSASALRTVKLVHTIVWAFFAGCIVALPFVAWHRQFEIVLGLIGLVLIETAVLVLNKWRCPLTLVASRYTQDRQDNFDIYLPLWLARYNKTIFGWWFAGDLLFSFVLWQRWI